MTDEQTRINAREHYSYGKVYMERGEFERALEECEASLELEPEAPDTLIMAGQCLMAMQKIEEASEKLEKAARLAPDFADAHYNLGKAYNELDLREKAINEFKEALNINPRYTAARRYLSALMKDAGEAEKRTRAAAEPQKHDEKEEQISKQANVHFHLGNALFQKNMYQEALAEFKESIRLRPNYPDVRNRLGELYVKRGQFGLAQEEFLTALKINPRYAQAMLNLAECYRAHSEQLMDKAEESFRRALEFDPTNARATRGLAVVRSIKNIDFV